MLAIDGVLQSSARENQHRNITKSLRKEVALEVPMWQNFYENKTFYIHIFFLHTLTKLPFLNQLHPLETRY